jgi:hypothetical protein
LQSISGVIIIISLFKVPTAEALAWYWPSQVCVLNPLVAFYDIHARKGEVLFFVLSRTPHEKYDIRKSQYNISALKIPSCKIKHSTNEHSV